MRIKHAEDFADSTEKVISSLIDSITDEGFRYWIDRYYIGFGDLVRNLKDSFEEFKEENLRKSFDVYSAPMHLNKWKDIIKEVFESEAYQVFNSFKFKSIIGSKLSWSFDEEESKLWDNVTLL